VGADSAKKSTNGSTDYVRVTTNNRFITNKSGLSQTAARMLIIAVIINDLLTWHSARSLIKSEILILVSLKSKELYDARSRRGCEAKIERQGKRSSRYDKRTPTKNASKLRIGFEISYAN